MSNSAIRLLERAARLWPERVYVEEEGGSATYAALLARARTIGAALLGDRRPVVVYLPKSIDALAVFFGAMCAGRPYAPVDAHIPVARLEKIAASLEPAYIVTSEALLPNLAGADLGAAEPVLLSALEGAEPNEAGVDAAIGAVIDTDPIYVMYTSGSTGTPKGVTIPHRGILDYADWVADTFAFDGDTVMANQAPFYFDNSTFDIYGTLRCGGKLLLTPETLFLFPLKLPEYLEEHGVTSIFWVPTVMINVANAGALEGRALPKLKNVAFCGEVMPNTQLNIWRRALPHCQYANLYGPTEITDVCCYYKVDRPFADHESLPIGKACENMRVRILTDDGREEAVGETGELCVLGSGVALGYWNAPEQTAKAFVPNPLTPAYPEIMYRTGDLGKWDADGNILFCGRRDHQFKLRGNRIELGDIETAAATLEGVDKVCALFDEANQEIILAVESSAPLQLRKVNLALGKLIPKYMLPRRLEVMEALPLTPNRKIDRVALNCALIGGRGTP